VHDPPIWEDLFFPEVKGILNGFLSGHPSFLQGFTALLG